jgi:hypothetical protein
VSLISAPTEDAGGQSKALILKIFTRQLPIFRRLFPTSEMLEKLDKNSS